MNKFLTLKSITILFSLLLLFSCTDDKLEAGLEILPESDQLIAKVDTLSIECFTYKGVSGKALGTSATTASYPIGKVFDSLFGETIADLAMELISNSAYKYSSDTMYSDAVVSLKLYLNTTNLTSYGQPNDLDINVYPLKSRYTYDKNTDQGIPFDYFDDYVSQEISTEHGNTIESNSIPLIDSGNVYSVVALDNSLAFKLLTDDDVLNVLPGLLLRGPKVLTSTGMIQNFFPNKSKLVLEYQRTSTEKNPKDTIFTAFSIYDVSKFQCYYNNNHTGRNAEIETAFRDTVNQIDKFYLQGLGGTRGIIKFPSLISFKKLHENSIGINLAELVLPIDVASLDDKFELPKRISVQGILDSRLILLPDDQISSYYFNGYLDETNLVYRINLSEYVNKYMLNDLDFILLNVTTAEYNTEVNSTLDYRTPGRVVLNSGLEDNINKAFIRIIYTQIFE